MMQIDIEILTIETMSVYNDNKIRHEYMCSNVMPSHRLK